PDGIINRIMGTGARGQWSRIPDEGAGLAMDIAIFAVSSDPRTGQIYVFAEGIHGLGHFLSRIYSLDADGGAHYVAGCYPERGCTWSYTDHTGPLAPDVAGFGRGSIRVSPSGALFWATSVSSYDGISGANRVFTLDSEGLV